MRIIILVLCAYIIPGSIYALMRGLNSLYHSELSLIPFLIGVIIGGLIYSYIIVKLDGIITTFEHELTHAIVAMLLFRKVIEFRSTRYHGGHIRYTNGFGGVIGNDIIGLSPYFLPTFTFILVSCKHFIPISYGSYYDVFIGSTFTYHIMSTISETKNNWAYNLIPDDTDYSDDLTDIGKRGIIYSGSIILTLSIMIHATMIYVYAYGTKGYIKSFTIANNYSKNTYKPIALSASKAINKYLAR